MQRQLQHYIAQRLSVKPDIINGSTSAAGFSVNIQAANLVIYFTRTWNPTKKDQATDRAYRIGQSKDVYVYYPVITAELVTFDMKLDKLLGWKRELSDDMLNGCGDLSAKILRTFQNLL